MAELSIQFVVVREGAVEILDSPPLLSSPMRNYGVERLEDHAVIVSDYEPFTQLDENALSWIYTFEDTEGDDDTVYRYFVLTTIDDVDYHIPRTTNFVKSACLVFGRYCNSTQIETRFGPEEVVKWLGNGDNEEPIEYAMRLSQHLTDAEYQIDDELRSYVPLDDLANEPRIIDMSIDLAAVRAIEARGVVDPDPNTNAPIHRLWFVKKRVMEQLARIKSGEIRLASDNRIRYPAAVNE